ncbi:MAG: phosphoglucomutase/phosphomannomutase family protein, partial [Anaerolineaceae bacterium]
GWKGPVVRTVSTTRMIDRLAKLYDIPVYETPVGFNYIADYMLKEDILIGGEESGGISFRGHIPEGDGILLGLLLIEIVASNGASLNELVTDLLNKVGPAVYQRNDIRLNHPVAKDRMIKILVDQAPQQIADANLEKITTIDGVKYIFSDDSWLLIRPSGTEPVLRVYAEGRDQNMVQALIGFGKQIAETCT